jgi:hypothetical protein
VARRFNIHVIAFNALMDGEHVVYQPGTHAGYFARAAARTARVIDVEWGQIRTSAVGPIARTQAAVAAIAPSCGPVPCIFRLPAIKGRMLAPLQS